MSAGRRARGCGGVAAVHRISPAAILAVARICVTADSGCEHCAAELLVHLDATFPGHRAALLAAWQSAFGPFVDEGEEGASAWEDVVLPHTYGPGTNYYVAP